MKKVFFGALLGMLLTLVLMHQWPIYLATTAKASEEVVDYLVIYDATIHEEGRGARSTCGAMEYRVPANQAVNNLYFSRRIAGDLSNYLGNEIAPGQIFVEVQGFYPASQVSSDPA